MYFHVTNGKTFHHNYLQRQMLKIILKSSKLLSEHLFYVQIMQFFGFDLWKHLCKQANHVAAILNQKPCNFAWIKFLAENHHVIVMRGGRVVRRCCVSYITGASNWYWLSWARPAILVVGKGRGGMFLFLLFLHFHSCSSFFPVPLFHLLYSPFYLFSPFLWETTQNDPQRLTCR